MLGAILPYATSGPPSGALVCDGTQYLRVDYPQLYAVLDAVFIVDADNFITPDLRGRVIVGSSATYAVGSMGGAASVALAETEMPAHTHTTIPHAHATVGTASPDLLGAIPGAAMIPLPSTTALAGVTVNATGGGQAHQNMQPYTAIKYCIVARM